MQPDKEIWNSIPDMPASAVANRRVLKDLRQLPALVPARPGERPAADVVSSFDVDSHNWAAVPIRAAFGAGAVHVCLVDAALDLARLAETFHGRVLRSAFHLRDDAEGGFHDLTIRIEDRLYVGAGSETFRVYAASPEAAKSTAEKIVATFRTAAAEAVATFEIVKLSAGCIESESVEVDSERCLLADPSLALYYGEDFPAWHEGFVASLQSRRSGLSIFDGPPGTGKTSYLRHLIATLHRSHRFYFIGSASLNILRDPEFVDFWSRESRTYSDSRLVAIIEDAESALLQRASDNRQEVSLLLNVTDGILGEFLRLQVICTTNAGLSELDRALMRPGRLMAHRHFGNMPPARARALAARSGRELPFDAEDYSLAEVFSGQPDPSRQTVRSLGFGAR